MAPARHNGGSDPRTAVFHRKQTPLCQFSNWRAGGVEAKKYLFYRLETTGCQFAKWRAVGGLQAMKICQSAAREVARQVCPSAHESATVIPQCVGRLVAWQGVPLRFAFAI